MHLDLSHSSGVGYHMKAKISPILFVSLFVLHVKKSLHATKYDHEKILSMYR